MLFSTFFYVANFLIIEIFCRVIVNFPHNYVGSCNSEVREKESSEGKRKRKSSVR